MYIRRDYSQPFFSDRRRRRGRATLRTLLLFALLVGGLLWFVDSQFPRLQVIALNAVGQGPVPTPFASALADQGYTRFMAGDLEAATDLFRRAVEQQPRNVDYLYEYGRLLIELQTYDEAVTIGDLAIEASPSDPRGYAIKARALDLRGEPEAAIPIGQQGLQVDREFAPLYAALASAYNSIDRYDVALENAEEAIALDPMDSGARRIYAQVLIWVGRYDEAIEQLEQAISINPNLVAPYFELAAQYRFRNEFELAVATYEAILTRQPTNPRANLRMCQLYVQIGQDNRAQGYCEDALAADSSYAEAMSMLGWVRYKRRNYEGAIEMFEQCQRNVNADLTAGEINEDTIRCWYMKGLAHYYLNECQQAWDILNNSLPMTSVLPSYAADTVGTQIRNGLSGVVARCTGYQGRALPTEIPPTAIPPTPIGG